MKRQWLSPYANYNHLQNIMGGNYFTELSKTLKFLEINFKTLFKNLQHSKKNKNSLDN